MLRGGFGVYMRALPDPRACPGLGNPLNQIGYSRSTPVPVTNDNGLTFGGNLTNPVPSGTLLEPIGSSLGLRTNLGGSPGTRVPHRPQQPAVLALQHRLRARAAR